MRRRSFVVGLAALAALAAPATAAGHARLLRTEPASGAVLARSPHDVRIVFDDTVRVGAGNAAVANATRESVTEGSARVRGRVLTIPLRPRLGYGDYSVRWSVVADDGHPERGVFAFAVGGAGGGTPAPVLTASVPLGWTDVAMRLLFYVGLLVAGGATVFAGLTKRYIDPLRRPLSQLLFFAFLLAFVGCSGAVRNVPGGTRGSLVLETALAVCAVGAAAAALAPLADPLLALAGGCALLLLAAPTLAGHALDRDQPWALSVPADLAHVGAAAVWIGGVAALLLVVPRAELPAVARGTITRRASSAAVAAVAALALSGLLRALTELRDVDQLWTTRYGQALLLKTALLAPVLALGWRNRMHLLDGFALLRNSVRLEAALLTIVVGVVAILVQLRPGAAAPVTTTQPATRRSPTLPPPRAVVDTREPGPPGVAVAGTGPRATVTVLRPGGTGRVAPPESRRAECRSASR